MTQERANRPERTLERILSIAGRAMAATRGSWGYLRASGVSCGPDTTDVAHCLHDSDATFIAHARSDFPLLLDQLQAEQAAHRILQAQLQDRLDWLGVAIRVANEQLNTLPWRGDGLSGFLAEGLERDQARWVGQVIEKVASALDLKALGLKDGSHEQHRARADVGGAAGCQRASAARPSHHPSNPCTQEGVVAPLT